MAPLLKLTTNRGNSLTLLDGSSPTGYMLPHGADFGNVAWQHSMSGPRGLLGAVATYSTPSNREISIPVRCSAVSKDGMASLINDVTRITEELRTFGGKLYWQAPGSSYRVIFDIFTAGDSWETSATRAIARNVVEGVIVLGAAPLAEGDPLDIRDEFTQDSADDWTVDSGTAPVWIGGELKPANTNTVRMRYTGTGYLLSDTQVQMKFTTGATTTGAAMELFARGSASAHTYLYVLLDATGGLSIGKRVAGSATALDGPDAYAISTTTSYWLRLTVQGSYVLGEVFTSEPTPGATAALSVSYIMTSAEAALFAEGYAGFQSSVADTNERYDDFVIRGNAYRSVSAPDVIRLPEIPGTHGPRFNFEVSASGSTSSNPAIWAQLGWWERPSIYNMVWNGDFEDSDLATNGWSASAFSLNSGATLSRVTTAARYGSASLQAVATNSSSAQGAAFATRTRFKPGRTYLGWGWVRAAAGTNNVGIVTGNTATDNGVTFYKAVSTSWQFLSSTWRPTAEREGLFGVAFRTQSAVNQTFTVDGAGMCETVATTITNAMTSGTDSILVTHMPRDIPTLPAYAVISPGMNASEIVRVTAASGLTLTIERGMEGTAASAHSADAELCFMPDFASHREGAGAFPPYGIIEGEAYSAVGGTNTWAAATDATARAGYAVLDSAVTAGTGNSYAEYQIDPAVCAPDAYTQSSEVAMEVYARVSVDIDLDSPVLTLSAAAPYTQRRYSAEFGQTGKALIEPSAGAVWRYVFLGTMRLPADRLNPQRWTLRVDYSWGSTTTTGGSIALDYLAIVPASARASSPEGKANSAQYPDFIGQVAETVKTIRADLSGYVRKPSGSGRAGTQDIGLGGTTLELPASRRGWEALFKLSNVVTGDPTIDATSDDTAHSVHVQFAMTPRFGVIRDG